MMRSVSEPSRFDRVGVVVHPRRDLDGALNALHAWAQACGAEVVQLPMPGIDREVAPTGAVEDCDAVIALGGDGTTLAALHAAAQADKPVLGVACGSLGALTAPMNMPLTPTMLLIPSAMPRSLDGNASVMIGAAFASRHAPPIPCTIRNTIRYAAPDVPVIQSIVSSSDATV